MEGFVHQPEKSKYLILFVLGLSGCVTLGDSFRRNNGVDVAAYTLNCPVDQVQLKGLSRRLDDAVIGLGEKVAVEGCGRRLVYRSTPSGWIPEAEVTGQGPAVMGPATSDAGTATF
jgi:hypothetical protein